MKTKRNRVQYTEDQISELYPDRDFDSETLQQITKGINEPSSIPAIALGSGGDCYTAPVVRVMGAALDWADLLAKAYLDQCPHTKAILVFTRRPRAYVDDPRIILVYPGVGNHYSPQHSDVDMTLLKSEERRKVLLDNCYKDPDGFAYLWFNQSKRQRCEKCDKALYYSKGEAEVDAVQFHANRPHQVYSCSSHRDDCPHPKRWSITTKHCLG